MGNQYSGQLCPDCGRSFSPGKFKRHIGAPCEAYQEMASLTGRGLARLESVSQRRLYEEGGFELVEGPVHVSEVTRVPGEPGERRTRWSHKMSVRQGLWALKEAVSLVRLTALPVEVRIELLRAAKADDTDFLDAVNSIQRVSSAKDWHRNVAAFVRDRIRSARNVSRAR